MGAEGVVVIVSDTGQAGTVLWTSADRVSVLLRNGEVWYGPVSMVREPQSPEDLSAAPIDVPRPEPKRKRNK